MTRLLCILVAFALTSAAAVEAQTVAATTKVIKFSGKQMTGTGHASGSCWTSSIASPRADAYRCMAGNEIHDPCFEIDSKSVACPVDVFANTGIVMKLTKPLPPAASPSPPQAWAMLLQGGAKCNRGTGTIVADFPYYCSGESSVCQGPDLSKLAPAYFVKCGKPADAMHVNNVSSTLVKTIYE
ncbi:MAG TPA: hypothetical protein VKR05_07615 [Candidatus Cybelea sp.]|nr:hypothetical protein [Candidatus Cybelea sp.]